MVQKASRQSRLLAASLALLLALPPAAALGAVERQATPGAEEAAEVSRAPGPGDAGAADPFVTEATDLMDVAEYAKAQRTINRGLARKSLPDTTLLELYLLEGTCWVSLGQAARARSSYAKVLTLNPGYALGPRVSPKVRAAFEATRQEMLKSGDLESAYEPTHTPVSNLAAGQDAAVKLAFGNAERAGDITRVVLHVRRLGTSDYATIDAARDVDAPEALYVARIPPYLLTEEREAYAMEYYLEAYSAEAHRLVRVGGPVLPLSFLVVPSSELSAGPEPEGDLPILPIAIGVGAGVVVAAGAVVGAVLLLAPKTGSATVTVRQ